MMDFNDITPVESPTRESRRDDIRISLLARLDSVLVDLFPAGKKRRPRR